MRPRPRARATYANVTSTLALVLALGGVSYAAVTLPPRSVGTPQLKSGAVTKPKIKAKAVTPAKLAPTTRALIDRPRGIAVISGSLRDLPSAGPGITLSRRGAVSGLTAAEPSVSFQGQTLSPARPLRAGHMTVRLIEDLPATSSAEVTLFAKPTPAGESDSFAVLSCTIVGSDGADDRTCTAAGPAKVPAASVLYVRVRVAGGSATADPGHALWGFTMEPA